MVEVEFEYLQMHTSIQANIEDKFQVIIDKFIQKMKKFSLDINSLTFICKRFTTDPIKDVENYMCVEDKKEKKMRVLVYPVNVEANKPVIIQSKNIICPKCYESCKYKIENYKIKLYGCINDHTTDNIKIKEFLKTQEINIANIICSNCKEKNKGYSFDHEFYKCLTCSSDLCPVCKSYHNLNHYVIKYELKDFICKKHKDFFTKFCKNCKINLCMMCDQEHAGHKTIYFGDLMPNHDKLKKQYRISKINLASN